MFKFLTNRPFWVNLLAVILLAFLLVFFVLQLLGWITRHGDYLTVPAVKGKSTQESIKILESQGFDVVIQDSIYTDSLPRGIVIKQLPDANATVKVNRTVFLTVNRYIPPMIDMPQLEGKSLQFALDLLRRNHLKLGDTTYKSDFMKGSVLEQLYNGKKIEQGTKVRWGSAISLVIASGLNNEQIIVPNLVGLTYSEAKSILDSAGISIGAIIVEPGITDTLSAFVDRQSPERYDVLKRPIYIRSGQLMDLYLSLILRNPTDSLDLKKTETP